LPGRWKGRVRQRLRMRRIQRQFDSDMNGIPQQGKLKVEGCAGADGAST